jgi:aminoglycoside phosphotransferase family enzyme
LTGTSHPQAPPEPASDEAGVALADKLAFLRRPQSYSISTTLVQARETHMSWVFLTGHEVYKLKKPVRHAYLDYGSLERRRAMCEQEVLLNRRLAGWVYLGLAALVRDPAGRLGLSLNPSPGAAPPGGSVVEWLVRMRRLPDAQMLDHAIRCNTVRAADARRTAAHLAAFFGRAPRAGRTPAEQLGTLRQAIAQNAAAIAADGGRHLAIAPLAARLSAFLDVHAALIERRVAEGRIVEGHGDLRPEHVFLGQPPAVIDCIEFDRELRLNDPLDELAFLWMECMHLGAGQWGELFLDTYLRRSGDHAPRSLLHFYMSLRACLRTRLALGHLYDAPDAARWLAKANRYFALATRFAAGL